MGLRNRLKRLEGAQPCEVCPYPQPIRTLRSTKIVYPDGSVDFQRDSRLQDDEPTTPKLCERCPYRPGGLEPPIRTIHIIGTVRARQDEY